MGILLQRYIKVGKTHYKMLLKAFVQILTLSVFSFAQTSKRQLYFDGFASKLDGISEKFTTDPTEYNEEVESKYYFSTYEELDSEEPEGVSEWEHNLGTEFLDVGYSEETQIEGIPEGVYHWEHSEFKTGFSEGPNLRGYGLGSSEQEEERSLYFEEEHTTEHFDYPSGSLEEIDSTEDLDIIIEESTPLLVKESNATESSPVESLEPSEFSDPTESVDQVDETVKEDIDKSLEEDIGQVFDEANDNSDLEDAPNFNSSEESSTQDKSDQDEDGILALSFGSIFALCFLM
mmetsp:Transcript_14086/g.20605  ORF Transcript_14086/g.20605 Transcript_14086/m.20605 type:complete len:290 (+) Transcript_14086:65-934(+)